MTTTMTKRSHHAHINIADANTSAAMDKCASGESKMPTGILRGVAPPSAGWSRRGQAVIEMTSGGNIYASVGDIGNDLTIGQTVSFDFGTASTGERVAIHVQAVT